jgi:tetratricopeptide (TPR) repeat protein
MSLTMSGAVIGTPAYMAPEQHRAEVADHRSDQFSFCVALYEALYGRVPRAGEAPGAPTQGPRALMAWLCIGLRVDAAERHASMDALVDGLERILGRRRRVVTAAAAATLVALTGVTGALALGARSERPPDPVAACAKTGAGMDPVWNAARARALAAHLAGGAPAYDPRAPARLVDGLDRFAGAWRTVRVEACQATMVRHEQTAVRLDQRVACLGRKLDSFHAFLDVLDEMPAGDALDRGPGAAPVISDLDACSDDAALRAQILPAAGSPERESRVGLQRRLDRADALGVAGKYDDGARIADEVVAAARAAGYHDLVGEALYARGRLEQRSGKGAAAETTLEEAVDEASAGGDQRLTARVMAFEVYIVGDLLGRTDEGIGIARAARGIARLAGDPPNTIAAIHSNLGNLYWYKGKVEPAFTEYTAALAIEERVLGPDHPDVAWSWSNVGMVTEARGDRAEARRDYQKALAITEKALGAEHPEVAPFLNNLAGLELGDEKLDAAEAAATRGLGIVERALGPQHYRAGELHATLGRIALAREHFAEARAHCDAAHRIFVAADDGGWGTAGALACRGQAALGLGERAAAVKDLEEALAILVDHDLDPATRAEVKAHLAPALWEGGDHARALQLADEAARAFEGKPAQADEAAKLAAWRTTHS